jgi:hypothetical protein
VQCSIVLHSSTTARVIPAMRRPAMGFRIRNRLRQEHGQERLVARVRTEPVDLGRLDVEKIAPPGLHAFKIDLMFAPALRDHLDEVKIQGRQRLLYSLT